MLSLGMNLQPAEGSFQDSWFLLPLVLCRDPMYGKSQIWIEWEHRSTCKLIQSAVGINKRCRSIFSIVAMMESTSWLCSWSCCWTAAVGKRVGCCLGHAFGDGSKLQLGSAARQTRWFGPQVVDLGSTKWRVGTGQALAKRSCPARNRFQLFCLIIFMLIKLGVTFSFGLLNVSSGLSTTDRIALPDLVSWQSWQSFDTMQYQHTHSPTRRMAWLPPKSIQIYLLVSPCFTTENAL